MTWRSLLTTFRTPAAVIPTLIISAFFLFVYNASLGNAAGFSRGGQKLPGLHPAGVDCQRSFERRGCRRAGHRP